MRSCSFSGWSGTRSGVATTKPAMRRIVAVALVLCLPLGALAQDLNEGLKAAKAGDFEKALKEWRPLGDKGVADAQYNIGLLYRHGRGVPRDYEKAVEWFTRAAAQEHADAMAELGNHFLQGRGVKRNDTKALDLLRRAAEKGVASAEFNIAIMHRYGRAVPKSYARAVIWYRKAADRGYIPAMDSLGALYQHGVGVQRDNIRAHKWFNLSSTMGSTMGARHKRYVQKKMTRDQVAEAERLALEWMTGFRKRTAK